MIRTNKKEISKVYNIPALGIILFFLLILSGVGYIAWDFLIEEYVQDLKAMDNFCIEQGYSHATDSNINSYYGYQIECDSEYIFSVILAQDCIKTDKWGSCKEDFPVYLKP